jgi:hypothetical protein
MLISEKAYDSIHRESLWSIMKYYGIPDKLIRMVKLLYETFNCAVLEDGEESDWFRVTKGVQQGCTISGFLFLFGKRLHNEKNYRRKIYRN